MTIQRSQFFGHSNISQNFHRKDLFHAFNSLQHHLSSSIYPTNYNIYLFFISSQSILRPLHICIIFQFIFGLILTPMLVYYTIHHCPNFLNYIQITGLTCVCVMKKWIQTSNTRMRARVSGYLSKVGINFNGNYQNLMPIME